MNCIISKNNFKDKVALVTGGRRGIGASIVKTFVENGIKVAFTYKTDIDFDFDLENTRILPIKADCGCKKSAKAAFVRTIEVFKKIDILVINAGITRDRVCWKLEEADFDAVLQTNLKGAYLAVNLAASHMRNNKAGKIIAISSINGLRGKAGQAAYTASKGGIIAMMKSIARELGPSGINVNVIAPGFILTDMTVNLPEDIKNKALDETVLKRLGKPADIANVALFLASDMSRHITGQVINVDGGQLI